MRRVLSISVLMFLLVSCGEDGRSTKIVVDSAVNQLESAAEKVGEKAEQAWDTTKAKAKDVKEELDDLLDKKKDSTR